MHLSIAFLKFSENNFKKASVSENRPKNNSNREKSRGFCKKVKKSAKIFSIQGF